MRILSISPNFNQNRNVNFGRFADENARRVVKQALTADPEEDYMQPVYNGYFKRIEECPYFEAYTSDSGTVKGRFDDEFVRKNSDDGYLMYLTDSIKEEGHLSNLSVVRNINNIVNCLHLINKALAGIGPERSSDGESTENYAHMRAEEETYR